MSRSAQMGIPSGYNSPASSGRIWLSFYVGYLSGCKSNYPVTGIPFEVDVEIVEITSGLRQQ